MLFRYLDHLLPIPAHLTVKPADYDLTKIGKQDNAYNYVRWPASADLRDWLHQNICSDLSIAGVQIITGEVALHRDKRQWALNYLLDTGGSNVITSWHRIPGVPDVEPLNPDTAARALASTLEQLESQCVELNRWHLISTEVLHKVTGVESTRVAVSIGLNYNKPLMMIR